MHGPGDQRRRWYAFWRLGDLSQGKDPSRGDKLRIQRRRQRDLSRNPRLGKQRDLAGMGNAGREQKVGFTLKGGVIDSEGLHRVFLLELAV